MPYRVGIFGGSGYTGAELLRLCAQHPDLDVVFATADTQAGTRAADLYPSLAAAYPDLVFADNDPAHAETHQIDLAFLALPHGASQHLVPDLRKRTAKIVDLAADFRLDDPALYPTWYGEEHHQPALLDEFVLGIPELFRDQLANADLVAAAGCYVTAAALALAPLIRHNVVQPTGVIVDAASGVSGAGRKLAHNLHYGTVNEDFTAYGLLNHRHTPEIEQAAGAVNLLFTPHLAPMTRGILATCYAKPAPTTTPDPLAVLKDAYADEPFVVVSDSPPSTKATLGSNCAHLTARYDERTDTVVVLSALDNLVKGASGQAIQCANLALGLPETGGLPITAVYP